MILIKTKDIKNVLATIGYIVTTIGISATPQMVKWYLSLYVIYLVAIWLHDESDHE